LRWRATCWKQRAKVGKKERSGDDDGDEDA
jgi:hypothetical protein